MSNNRYIFGYKGAGFRTSLHQAFEIKSEALAFIDRINEGESPLRQVTYASAVEVLRRSLNETRAFSFSVRKREALKDLANFASALQGNLALAAYNKNADLFPIAHPFSERQHNMNEEALSHAHLQWTLADRSVQNEIRPLLASALSEASTDVEKTYATSRLRAVNGGYEVLAALTAAFSGNGNSRIARRIRAMRQKRDSEGRFAYMGGGGRARVRRKDGSVEWLNGRPVGVSDEGFQLELGDGRIAVIPADKFQAVKAYIPNKGRQAFSGVKANYTTEEAALIIDEADLKFVDAPQGWVEQPDFAGLKEGERAFGDGDYVIAKDDQGNFRIFDYKGNELAQANNWRDAIQATDKDALGGQEPEEATPNDLIAEGLRDIAANPEVAELAKVANKAADFLSGKEFYDEDPSEFADRLEKVAKFLEAGEYGSNKVGYADDFKEAAKAVRGKIIADKERAKQKGKGKPKKQKAAEQVPAEAVKSEKADTGELIVPEGAYQMDDFDYDPVGPMDNVEAEDYTDDPKVLARKFSKKSLLDGLRQALLGREVEFESASLPDEPVEPEGKVSPAKMRAYKKALKEWEAAGDENAPRPEEPMPEPPSEEELKDYEEKLAEWNEIVAQQQGAGRQVQADGYALMSFEDGDELVPAEAIRDALIEQGVNVQDEVKKIYNSVLPEEDKNVVGKKEKAQAKQEDIADVVEQDITAEELKELESATATSDSGVVDLQADVENNDLPELLQGLTEEEKQDLIENGHQNFLPKDNFRNKLPNEFHQLDPNPFDEIIEVEEGDELNQNDWPVGWTNNPYYLAKNYDTQSLINQLYAALVGVNGEDELGKGRFSEIDTNGEEFFALIPAEAIRDALKLQGEDTDALIDEIIEDYNADQDLSEEPLLGKTIAVRQFKDADGNRNKLIAKKNYGNPEQEKGLFEVTHAINDGNGWVQQPSSFFDTEEEATDYLETRKAELKAVGAKTPKGNEPDSDEIEAMMDNEGIRESDEITGEAPEEVLPARAQAEPQGPRPPREVAIQDLEDGDVVNPNAFPNSPGFPDGLFVVVGNPELGEEQQGFEPADGGYPMGWAGRDADIRLRPLNQEAFDAAMDPEKNKEGSFENGILHFRLSAEEQFLFHGTLEDMKNNGLLPQEDFVVPENATLNVKVPSTPKEIVKELEKSEPEIIKSATPEGSSDSLEALIKSIQNRHFYNQIDFGTNSLPLIDQERIGENLPEHLKQIILGKTPERFFGEEFLDGRTGDKVPLEEFNAKLGFNLNRIAVHKGVVVELKADGKGNPVWELKDGSNKRFNSLTEAIEHIDIEIPDEQALTNSLVNKGIDEKVAEESVKSPIKRSMVKDLDNALTNALKGFLKPVMVDSENVRSEQKVNELQNILNDVAQGNLNPVDAAAAIEKLRREKVVAPKTRTEDVPKFVDAPEAPVEARSLEEAKLVEDQMLPPAPPTSAVVKVGKVKTKDLKPGMVTKRDGFVIEHVSDDLDEDGKHIVLGYFPGGPTQEKRWRPIAGIEVVQNLRPDQLPQKGSAPEIHQPKPEDYEGGEASPDYAMDMLKWKAQLVQARARWTNAPEVAKLDPAQGAHRAKVKGADLRPGDVMVGKGNFVVVSVTPSPDPADKGKLLVEGYYPGHQSQVKKWNPETPFEVFRNVAIPEKGDLPEFHIPFFINKNGNWQHDKNDVEGNRIYNEMIANAEARFNAPQDLPFVDAVEGGEKKAAPGREPRAPRDPADPLAQGEFEKILAEANGDPAKLKELLNGKELIFFDFETTGIDPNEHNVWQLGAVKVVNGEIVDRFNVYINPERPVDPKLVKKLDQLDPDGNLISDEFLAEQMGRQDAMKLFRDFAGQNPLLVAQNSKFDRGYLEKIINEDGLDMQPAGYFDPQVLARMLFSEDPDKPFSVSLKPLANHFGIELKHHDAASDSEALQQVFNKILDRMIETGYGKQHITPEAMKAWFDNENAKYEKDLAKFKEDHAAWVANKAIADAEKGKPVNLENVIKEVNNPAPKLDAQKAEDIAGSNATKWADGPMLENPVRLAKKDWILNPENARKFADEEIKGRDIEVGDVMRGKGQNDQKLYQVLGIRENEKGKLFFLRANLENGFVNEVEFWPNNDMAEVYRPISPNSLKVGTADAPEGDPNLDQVINPEDVPADVPSVVSIDAPETGIEAEIAREPQSDGSVKAVVTISDNEGNILGVQNIDGASNADVENQTNEVINNLNDLIKAIENMPASRPFDAGVITEPSPSHYGRVIDIVDVNNGKNRFVVVKDFGNPRVEKGLFVVQHLSRDENGNFRLNKNEEFDTEIDAVNRLRELQKENSSKKIPSIKKTSKPAPRLLDRTDIEGRGIGEPGDIAPLPGQLEERKAPTAEAQANDGQDCPPGKFRCPNGQCVDDPAECNDVSIDVGNPPSSSNEDDYEWAINPFDGKGYWLPKGMMFNPDGKALNKIPPTPSSPKPKTKGKKSRKKRGLNNVENQKRWQARKFRKPPVFWKPNRGLFQDANGVPVNVGDFIVHNNPEKAAKFGAVQVVARVSNVGRMRMDVNGKPIVDYASYVRVRWFNPEKGKFEYRIFATRMVTNQNPDAVENPAVNKGFNAFDGGLPDVLIQDWNQFGAALEDFGVERFKGPDGVDAWRAEAGVEQAMVIRKKGDKYYVYLHESNIHGERAVDPERARERWWANPMFVSDDVEIAANFFIAEVHNRRYGADFAPNPKWEAAKPGEMPDDAWKGDAGEVDSRIDNAEEGLPFKVFMQKLIEIGELKDFIVEFNTHGAQIIDPETGMKMSVDKDIDNGNWHLSFTNPSESGWREAGVYSDYVDALSVGVTSLKVNRYGTEGVFGAAEKTHNPKPSENFAQFINDLIDEPEYQMFKMTLASDNKFQIADFETERAATVKQDENGNWIVTGSDSDDNARQDLGIFSDYKEAVAVAMDFMDAKRKEQGLDLGDPSKPKANMFGFEQIEKAVIRDANGREFGLSIVKNENGMYELAMINGEAQTGEASVIPIKTFADEDAARAMLGALGVGLQFGDGLAMFNAFKEQYEKGAFELNEVASEDDFNLMSPSELQRRASELRRANADRLYKFFEQPAIGNGKSIVDVAREAGFDIWDEDGIMYIGIKPNGHKIAIGPNGLGRAENKFVAIRFAPNAGPIKYIYGDDINQDFARSIVQELYQMQANYYGISGAEMTREQAIAYAQLKNAGFVSGGFANFDNMRKFDDDQRGFVWRENGGGRVVSITAIGNGNFLVKAFRSDRDWNNGVPAYQEQFSNINDAADKVNAHLRGATVNPKDLTGGLDNVEVLPNRDEPNSESQGESGGGETPPAPSAPNAPAGGEVPPAGEDAAPEIPANWDVDWVKKNAKEIKVTTGNIKLGDFILTRNDRNAGKVVKLRDAGWGVGILVQYPDGREFEYGPYNRNIAVNNVYRVGNIDGQEIVVPEAPKAPSVKPTPDNQFAIPNFDELVANPRKLQEALERFENILPKRVGGIKKGFTRTDREIGNRVRDFIDAIGRKNEDELLTSDTLSSQLDSLIYKLEGNGKWSNELNLLKDLSQKIKENKERLREERLKEFKERLNAPFPEGIVPDENEPINIEKIKNVLEEVIQRLPDSNMLDFEYPDRRLKEYIEELLRGIPPILPLDLDALNRDKFVKYANYLANAKDGDLAYLADYINKLNANWVKNIDNAPAIGNFGDSPDNPIDPKEVFAKRVEANENIIDIPSWLIDDIEANADWDYYYLKPFVDEIKAFRNGAKPAGSLSYEANRLLSHHLNVLLKDNQNTAANPEQALDAARLLFALNFERAQVEGAQKDVSPEAKALTKLRTSDVKRALRAATPGKKLIVDGVDTGFIFDGYVHGGITNDKYWIKNARTGEKLMFKIEENNDIGGGYHDLIAQHIGLGMGLHGVPAIVLFEDDHRAFLMRVAGEGAKVKEVGQGTDDPRSVEIMSMLGLHIIDGILDNTDRHGNNYLVAKRNNFKGLIPDGADDDVVIAIDNGLSRLIGAIWNTNNDYAKLRSVKEALAGKNHRNDGGQRAAVRLMKAIGKENYAELAKLSAQQLKQYFARMSASDIGIPEEAHKLLLERLEELENLSLDDWKYIAGKLGVLV